MVKRPGERVKYIYIYTPRTKKQVDKLSHPFKKHQMLGIWHIYHAESGSIVGRMYRMCRFPAPVAPVLCFAQTSAGWWFEPLWKVLLNWDDYSQYIEKKKMFQTTNQSGTKMHTKNLIVGLPITQDRIAGEFNAVPAGPGLKSLQWGSLDRKSYQSSNSGDLPTV